LQRIAGKPCQQAREAAAQEERDRRVKEAEDRAKEQKESANKLRRRAIVAAGAAVAAFILLVMSVVLWLGAQKQSLREALGSVGGRPIVITQSAPSALAISPDNHWLVTGSEDHTARLWDLRAKDPAASPAVLRGHEGEVYAVAISPDNHWLVTGGSDGTERL
jgi:hypothetical protein